MKKLSSQEEFLGTSRLDMKIISYFYRTRVRSLVMLVSNSLTDQLTHWLPFSKLDGYEWYQLLDDVATATKSCENLSKVEKSCVSCSQQLLFIGPESDH